MTAPLAVPTDVLLRLSHACLEHVAGGAGVRILHVKGVSLHPELSAGRGASSDCDVLVDPAGVSALVQELLDQGWEQRTHFEQGSVFGHAATFYSPVWGTVDLHRHFPGLEADPARTFEEFWSRRETVELGGWDCAVPDLVSQRLLLLVHAARDAMGRRDGDLASAWTALDDAERAQLDALADRLGARVPLAIVTGRPERARGLHGKHLWEAVHRDANPTEVWRARLRDARGVRERVRVLLSAAHVNRDHLEIRLGHPPTPEELRREWWERWPRGLRRLGRRG
ncbi:nucleotidyltransferase family protein [Brachybacterium sp. JHP9]|uniref:Nucleotidyltransferase family protein n=1 Tax=Brachybacterium equifaecis TaxID=2910770 RepID=A0ABT0R198_9MICO|nr:nucleotidyltransferase family protein [Brachybacterium equifaecis]MCL6423228.1 nucleotidyltransferase family protein [Brachybacterium equifaecis]